MDFRLTADQSALVEAIDKLALQFEAKPTEFRGFALLGGELDKELEDGQYFDIAQVPELGAISAATAVERLARVPFAAEFALSMLVRPQLPGEWPRPLAVVDNGRPGRFVATARERPRARGIAVCLPDGTMEARRTGDAAIERTGGPGAQLAACRACGRGKRAGACRGGVGSRSSHAA
jgi:hypothetical protein